MQTRSVISVRKRYRKAELPSCKGISLWDFIRNKEQSRSFQFYSRSILNNSQARQRHTITFSCKYTNIIKNSTCFARKQVCTSGTKRDAITQTKPRQRIQIRKNISARKQGPEAFVMLVYIVSVNLWENTSGMLTKRKQQKYGIWAMIYQNLWEIWTMLRWRWAVIGKWRYRGVETTVRASYEFLTPNA